MSAPSTIYLVSGANRGLGLGFVKRILETRNDAFVYAGVRDTERANALHELSSAYPGRVAILKYVSADELGNTALAKEIEARHGRVDTVIANAGIGNSNTRVDEVTVSELQEHYNVNVVGTIVLFKAIYHLLKKSASPRFAVISSMGGCIDGDVIKAPFGLVGYATSKAALNWATRKIHFENEWLVAFPMSPGPVDTDMLKSNIEADTSGLLKGNPVAWPSVAEVSSSLLKLIDNSTRDNDGGQFIHVDGSRLPW